MCFWTSFRKAKFAKTAAKGQEYVTQTGYGQNTSSILTLMAEEVSPKVRADMEESGGAE